MAEATNLLEMRGITKEFPGVKALSDVNLVVRRGEIHAICGENGAGKSTLMKVLSGVHPHGTYDGEILFDGQPVTFKDIKASERAGIVIIHQELALIPELSIAENIFLGNEYTRHGAIDWVETNNRARRLLERVGLNEEPETPVKAIGVGKQQLVEIAKAFNKDVKLLILDEPTSALNEEDSAHLLSLITDLRDKGVTSIIISHKLNEVAAISDSVTILRDGQTIETLDVRGGDVDEDRIIRGMVGRSLESRFPDRVPQIGDTFFEARGITVEHPTIPGRFVCKNSDFFVRRGEIVGFAGVMGAGRTELMRAIFGRSYGIWRGGEVLIDGAPADVKDVPSAIKAGIAYVSEDRKTLGLNLLDDVKRTTVAAKLRKITRGHVLDKAAEYGAAEHYRKAFRIKTPSVDTGVAGLSGGNQQKVVLGKWLFTDPELLILDEPTRGIDVGAKYEIYGIIQDLAAQGKGVIVVSSELPELLGLSDRIYTICEGAITGCLPAAEATQENLMRLMTTTRSSAPTTGQSHTPAPAAH